MTVLRKANEGEDPNNRLPIFTCLYRKGLIVGNNWLAVSEGNSILPSCEDLAGARNQPFNSNHLYRDGSDSKDTE